MFAELENVTEEILAMLLSGQNIMVAFSVLQGNSLSTNLAYMRKLAAFEKVIEFDRLDRLIKAIDSVRQMRNLFIHGTWRITPGNLKRGTMVVQVNRVTHKERGDLCTWSRGDGQIITWDQMTALTSDLTECLKQAKEIKQALFDTVMVEQSPAP
jgi:hypothetical protein